MASFGFNQYSFCAEKNGAEQTLIFIEPKENYNPEAEREAYLNHPQYRKMLNDLLYWRKQRKEKKSRIQSLKTQQNKRKKSMQELKGKMRSVNSQLSQLESSWSAKPEPKKIKSVKFPANDSFRQEHRTPPSIFMELDLEKGEEKSYRRPPGVRNNPELKPYQQRIQYNKKSKGYQLKLKAREQKRVPQVPKTRKSPVQSVPSKKYKERIKKSHLKNPMLDKSSFQKQKHYPSEGNIRKNSVAQLRRKEYVAQPKAKDMTLWNVGVAYKTLSDEGSQNSLRREGKVSVSRIRSNGDQWTMEVANSNTKGNSAGKLRKFAVGYKHFVDGYEDEDKLNPYVALMLDAWRADITTLEGRAIAGRERTGISPILRVGAEWQLDDLWNLDVFVEHENLQFEMQDNQGTNRKVNLRELNLGLGVNRDF